jgi:cGMP-dependent protein kinase 2
MRAVRGWEQGDPGDQFYIIKEGEAVVYQQTAQGTRKVNHLFKADFFGERALLTDEPRAASVEAITKLRSGMSGMSSVAASGGLL